MNPIALITGATSGIGAASARRLASLGYNLIITGRRSERLQNIADEIRAEYPVEILPLSFDVRNREEVEAHLGNLPDPWRSVSVLVNNAGLAAGLDPIQSGDIEDWERMIDTNIKGLLYVTRTISPGMIARGAGHIINIGSIAGKEVYSNGNVYCATKHAVDALSKAMRIDMLPYGIKVTQICPGAVETEFSLVRFHDDQAKADAVYKGFTPLCANDIAECIAAVLNLPDNICINDMVVMPKAQAGSGHFFKQV
ncbi:NAD(P)-dependent oxidoreductase [Porphyromonas gingivalis]|uniref:SDR family oxidoreductase n=1 Tax=Porphyromonas gingivalis TaxID=837 RepID=UPI0003AD7546|nr:SDR family oxidoreductase [Porphyromonas gingivalis]ATS06167.1 NAD(P)-dependent oxidoreductase [Porphyromonas gingivalis]ATS10271.1 NAD(P)-dependent oxidoreductase [Porphyromonas gingivalis]ERJ81697.1 putative serine 3-dehydrogenase [Porphyromonas gingivalis F0185]MCE8171922.1 SDR family oxidoreductase [Porphyromonas gingivalis]MDP0531293.1 SDR family oxidoreductase [Porphyromonas gingivalis]